MTTEKLTRDVQFLAQGKQIASIEADGPDRVTFTFADGTKMALSAHGTIYGPHLDVYEID